MLNYDSFDFSPYLLVNDIGRPLLPPQDLTTKKIYGRDGVYFFEKQHGAVVIPVDVVIYENNSMTYREMARFLAGKLNKKKEKPIVFEDEPDRYIDGIISGETDLETIVKTGEGTLNFHCSDPFYYALDDEVFTFSTTGSHDFTRNKGNTESLPQIEIQGTNSNGSITLTTDNTEIVFDGDLASGETLVFDSDLITCYIFQTDGEKRSGNNNIDTMDFPILVEGSNNVTVSTSGDATVSEIKVYARSRWI